MGNYFEIHYNAIKYPIDSEKSRGLRNAQLGAIHAISSFFTLNKKDAAIVIMPTGSGKTAVLMLTPYLIRKQRVLVVTRSKMVCGQIAEDFSELRTLCVANVFNTSIKKPNVFELEHLYTKEYQKDLDTMTMVNNKFVILSIINNLINEGIDKKDIFVTDKSFLISTNYKTYFENGNEFWGKQKDIVKMYSLGRLISMEPNEDIFKMNCLFEFYKKLNSITNKYLKCRIRSTYLADSYDILFRKSIEQAYEILLEGAKNQVCDVFERHISPDINKKDMIIKTLENQKDLCLEKSRKKFKKIMKDSRKKFTYTYNRFDRPVVGIYHPDGHYMEIINADQMYKNGEESDTQIKLKRITKNSPVAIAMLVTGPMVAFLGYLLYREHNVNSQIDIEDLFDIPQDDEGAINNILGNDDGNLLDTGNVKAVDAQVKEMAHYNLNKLEIATNKRVVHLEMNIENKITIETVVDRTLQQAITQ